MNKRSKIQSLRGKWEKLPKILLKNCKKGIDYFAQRVYTVSKVEQNG